jgi:hypothetical protein
MRKILIFSVIGLVVLGGIAAGGYWAYWNYVKRYEPTVISKNQAEIQKLLDGAGWVSPGRQGATVYFVTHRNCNGCTRYELQEFPKLDVVAADTRVITYAPADVEGLPKSTAEERSTVAELWLNRSWTLYQQWMSVPYKAWKAEGIRPADGDIARTAVVGAGRDFVAQLEPLLQANGVAVSYPLVIWRDSEDRIKVCACSDPRMYHHIRKDLGAPETAPKPVPVAPAPEAVIPVPQEALPAPVMPGSELPTAVSPDAADVTDTAPAQTAPAPTPAPQAAPAQKPAAAPATRPATTGI